MAKMFSSSPSSDRLVQICTTLSGWFSHKTAAFSTEQCISRCFFTGLKSLKNYGFICNTIFSSCVHMSTNQYCIHLYWGSRWGHADLLLCDRWQTSAQVCICC